MNTFNYYNRPVNWREFIPAKTGIPAEITFDIPLIVEAEWYSDDERIEPLHERANIRFRQDRSIQSVVYPYPEDALDRVHSEVSALLRGEEAEGSVYEASIELLMQAQELVTAERKQRRAERKSLVCAALISTTAACEVFVRRFIQTHGNPLHRFIIKEKEKVFSIDNLLKRC